MKRLYPGLLLALLTSTAEAAEIQLVAATRDKATVIINGGRPRTLHVGQKTVDGIQLLSANANAAEFSTADGKRRRIDIGGIGRIGSGTPGGSDRTRRTTLQADGRGHFYATVHINGIPVRGMIDTGASGVVMSGRQARSLGIDFRKGKRSYASTASGYSVIYKVSLNEIRLEDIIVYGVSAAVIDGDFPQEPLLGNTLLNQMNMERQGDQLILSKRF